MCKNFTYLGSTVSESASLHQEITLRMGKASAAYGKLQKRLWRNRHVTIRAECKVYRAVVLSIPLYSAETWTIYQSQAPPQGLRFSQGRGKRLVMNRKRPWEGYRQQAKRRLVRCLLPAFLCVHIFIERERRLGTRQCQSQVKKLQAYMMPHLREIMNISWKDKITK